LIGAEKSVIVLQQTLIKLHGFVGVHKMEDSLKSYIYACSKWKFVVSKAV